MSKPVQDDFEALIEFLRRQLEADRFTATAASRLGQPTSWHAGYTDDGDQSGPYRGVVDDEGNHVVIPTPTVPSEEQALHISAWAPGRVLDTLGFIETVLDKAESEHDSTTAAALAQQFSARHGFRDEWMTHKPTP